MSHLLQLGHVEAILWPVLLVLGPVDFLAQHVVLLVLIEVVVDDYDLAIGLPDIFDELVGLKAQVLSTRGTECQGRIIVLHDVVDLGATEEDVWANSCLL